MLFIALLSVPRVWLCTCTCEYERRVDNNANWRIPIEIERATFTPALVCLSLAVAEFNVCTCTRCRRCSAKSSNNDVMSFTSNSWMRVRIWITCTHRFDDAVTKLSQSVRSNTYSDGWPYRRVATGPHNVTMYMGSRAKFAASHTYTNRTLIHIYHHASCDLISSDYEFVLCCVYFIIIFSLVVWVNFGQQSQIYGVILYDYKMCNNSQHNCHSNNFRFIQPVSCRKYRAVSAVRALCIGIYTISMPMWQPTHTNIIHTLADSLEPNVAAPWTNKLCCGWLGTVFYVCIQFHSKF